MSTSENSEYRDFFHSYVKGVDRDHADWFFDRLECIRQYVTNALIMSPKEHKEFLAFGFRHLVEQYSKDFESSSQIANPSWSRKINFALEFAKMNGSFDIDVPDEYDEDPKEVLLAILQQDRDDQERQDQAQAEEEAYRRVIAKNRGESQELTEAISDEDAYDQLLNNMFSYQEKIDVDRTIVGLADRIKQKLVEGTSEEKLKDKVQRKLREMGIDPNLQIEIHEPTKIVEDPPEKEFSNEEMVIITRDYNGVIALMDRRNETLPTAADRDRQSVRDLAEFIAKMQLNDVMEELALFLRRKNKASQAKISAES